MYYVLMQAAIKLNKRSQCFIEARFSSADQDICI